MDNTTATILANEARRTELKTTLSAINQEIQTTSSLASLISGANMDAQRRYQAKASELAALEAGAGPGLTADFGAYSAIDQLLRVERFAGKGASVDYIKANPECTEADAVGAWRAGALAATGLDIVIQDPGALGQVYRRNLRAAGLTQDEAWESQRAWIVATDKTVIMGA